MPSDIAKLRVQAIRAGHDRGKVRGMDESELRALLNGKGSKSKAKAATKAATGRKTGTVKRGRPKGSTTRKTSTARGRGAASRTPAATAKRGATSRTKGKSTTTKANGNPGRHVVGRLNWRKKGFSPREGSLKAQVFAALKENDGDKDAAYKVLRRRIKTLYKGIATERAESLLAYQLARVTWEFAQATGQHVKSDNRVQYGTGGTGEGLYVPGGGHKPARGRGRPKGSTSKGTARKGSTSGTKAQTAKRGPGRPKGSTTKASSRKAGTSRQTTRRRQTRR